MADNLQDAPWITGTNDVPNAPWATHPQPSILSDIGQSTVAGLERGTLGLAGLPGDIGSLASAATSKLGSLAGVDPQTIEAFKQHATQGLSQNPLTIPFARGPTTSDLTGAVEHFTGPIYHPQTIPGQYAQTIAEFAPAIIGGPESLATKALTRVVAPAVASETAGQITKDTAAEPYARILAAIGTGAAAPKVPSLFSSIRPSTPEELASKWLSHAMRADGLTMEQALAKAQQLGPEGMLAELGPNLTGTMQSIATQPGSGKADIFSALEQRHAATRDRIDQAITDVMGPRVNVANLTRENMVERSDAARDLYDKWRTISIHPTNELKALIPQLDAAGAFAQARQKAAVEGINWDKNFFTGGNRKNYPTAQSWDYVKRSLDDMIANSKNQFGENTDWTRIYTGLKAKLLNAIDNSNGEGAEIWKQARKAWGDPTSIMRARQEGLKVWNPSIRRDDLLYSLTDMSQPERNAFKEGSRDALAEIMDRSVRGDTNVRNMLLAPTNKDKLSYLADNKNINSADLTAQLEREAKFAETRGMTIKGSQTEPRRAMGELMTAKPEDTLIGKIRNIDFAQPFKMAPKALENFAARNMVNKYEAARNALASRLITQGPERDMAVRRALGQPIPPAPSLPNPQWPNWYRAIANAMSASIPARTNEVAGVGQ